MRALGAPSEALRRKAVQRAFAGGFGLDVRASDIRFVEIGRRSKSMLNRVEAAAASHRSGILIEKLARSRREARFYEACRNRPSAPALDLLPLVHQTLIRALVPELLFFTSASYIERVATGIVVPHCEMGHVAARVARLGEVDLALPVAPSLSPIAVRHFTTAVRRDPRIRPEARCELAAMHRRLPGFLASSFWKNIPRVVCHNDLHQTNIGNRDGDPERLVVFDWEAVGLNRAGADLDRLFPADGSFCDERAFAEASEAYRSGLSRKIQVAPVTVELVAGVAALQRRMRRYVKDRRTDGSRLSDVLRTWRRLDARLKN